MKKTFIAAAALCAISGAAHAESTVALYGLLDASLNYTSNTGGNSRVNMDSGTMQGSRWGLRFTEELGSGLKVVGVIESGFHIGNGHAAQKGRLFGRQAYVGLSSDRFGTVTMGRQYLVSSDFVSPLTMTSWAGNLGVHPLDLDNLDNSHRADNTIKYISANYSGFQFGGSVSPGGIAGRLGQDLVWSLGAGYNNGPFAAGVSYISSRDAKASPLNKFSKLGWTDDWKLAGNPADVRYHVAALGANYKIGSATVGAVISHTDFKAANNAGLATRNHLKAKSLSAELHTSYQLSPTLQVGAGYSFTRITQPGEPGTNKREATPFHQVSLGSSYALSKRTDVYVLAAVQRATGKHAQASIGDTGDVSSVKSQFKTSIGLRHKF